MKNKENKEENIDLEIYNEEQLYWVNIKDNTTASIKQMEDGIKLQKEIQILAEAKIEENRKV